MRKSSPCPSASSSRAMRAGVFSGLVSTSRRSCARSACASACRPCDGGAPTCHSPASLAWIDRMRASCQTSLRRAQASCSVETFGSTSIACTHSRAARKPAMPWQSGSPVASTTTLRPASRASLTQPGTALNLPVRSSRSASGRISASSRASVRAPPITRSAARRCTRAVALRLAAPSSSTPSTRQGLGSGKTSVFISSPRQRAELASAILRPSKSQTSTCRWKRWP